MAESVSEKVVRLETQMTDTKLQLNRVEDKVDTLIGKVDDIALFKVELANLRKEYQTAMKNVINEVAQLKRRRFIEKWLYPTLSAAFAIIFGYLVASAFHLRVGG